MIVSPVYDREGELTNLLAVSRDVTTEVLRAGERALVTRELAHRISNLFAVVDGIIGLSARKDPAAQPFAKTLRQRIGGLKRALAYVGATDDAQPALRNATLHGLLRSLLEPYGVDTAAGVGVSISGKDQALSEAAITPLALIFNELATNALKYGALASNVGVVKVTTNVEQNRCLVTWNEVGAATAAASQSGGGFGTTLLDRVAEDQLGGTLKRTWKPDGLVIDLSFPRAMLV